MSRVRKALRVFERVLAVVGAGFIVYSLCFDVSVVTSDSMKPTLLGTSRRNGDWVLTERISRWFRAPRRWEVLTIRKADGAQVMKRVAGLPGESVSLIGRRVAINGQAVPAPPAVNAIRYVACGALHKGASAPCGDGYFVLGDDSWDSQDSRFEGPVAPADIVGRAWLRIWPLRRIGWVNP